MKGKRAARYYAEALFNAAQKQGQEEDIGEKIASLNSIFGEYTEFQKILANPLISTKEKEKALKDLLPRVLSRKKEEAIAVIATEYQRLLDEAKDVEAVEVKVAAPLTTALELEMKTRLTSLIGKKVRLDIKLEPEILGGLVIHWGDRVVDASIKKKLELLEAHLKTAIHAVN